MRVLSRRGIEPQGEVRRKEWQPMCCRVVSGRDGKERDRREVCSRKTRETESLHKGRNCLELKTWQDRVG